MRTHKALIHMVAMLALVLGFIPPSAIASHFASDCEMPCCLEKVTKQVQDPVCTSGCEMAQSHSQPATSIQPHQDGPCDCSIGPSPRVPHADLATTSALGITLQVVVANVSPALRLVAVSSGTEIEPGFYGGGSGPPAARPNYVSLGRAPPVFLA